MITLDILRDCNIAPVAGIKQRVLLINSVDLPDSKITRDTKLPNELITKIRLNPGKSGFFVDGFKQSIYWENAYNSPEDGENGFTHNLKGLRISNPTPEIRRQINEMKCGTNVYALVERNWKGKDDKDAYLFFGGAFGLELTELEDSSNTNDGTIVFSLGTPNGFQEPYVPPIYFEGTRETTQKNFDLKFDIEVLYSLEVKQNVGVVQIGLWQKLTGTTGISTGDYAIYDGADKKGRVDELKEIGIPKDGSEVRLYLLGLHTKDTGLKENNFIIGNIVDVKYNKESGTVEAKWKAGQAQGGRYKYFFSYNDLTQVQDIRTTAGEVLDWSSLVGLDTTPITRYRNLASFKRENKPEGIYYFNVGGQEFRAKALSGGWVFVMVGYGGDVKAVSPKTDKLYANISSVLNKSNIEVLDFNEIRLISNDTGTKAVDATTSNSTLVARLKAFETLQYKPSLNTANDDWTGTNSAYLKANATGEFVRFAPNLDRVVFATEGDGNGLHWIPERGDHKPTFNIGEIATDKYMALLVRA